MKPKPRPSTLTLKAAHFKTGDCVAFFPTWISNGHWAIKRALVSNSATFNSPETITAAFGKATPSSLRGYEKDDLMSDLQARSKKKEARVWTGTSLSWRNPADRADYVIFISGDQHVMVNRDYLELLPAAPFTLYGPAHGPLADERDPEQQSLIVMPVKNPDRDEHLKPVVALVHATDARIAAEEAEQHADAVA